MSAELTDRFWSKVDKNDTDCWLWTGALNSRGYGCWGVHGVSHLTHRLAYEALVGPIPDGLTIDHLCRVKACCNPAHLEVVTRAENTQRAAAGPGSGDLKDWRVQVGYATTEQALAVADQILGGAS